MSYIEGMTSSVPKTASILDASDEETEARALAVAEEDAAAGRLISHDAMKRWLLSWGTQDELPPPEGK